MQPLELLAPARNLSVGIAAIDCGADAVYMAGPAFGARQAAGNSIEDVRELCRYAHRFGVRIFVTVNTILLEEELPQAQKMVRELVDAGADGLIVQDLSLLSLCEGLPVALHASTQCAIRTPERAAFLEGLGFSRIVPERQLSLEEIRAIRRAVSCEIECFVHGALCVCYSGACYLSELLTGRSANRGACAQACRSRYDLIDGDGKVLLRDKALLSLRDLNLLEDLEALADAGVCSFKIEGRLKGVSYVRNVVRAYSQALDALVARYPDRYCRASFGRVEEGFTPDLQKTFQRGYTRLYLDGRRERPWSSADAPKFLGEKVGRVLSLRPSVDGSLNLTLALEPGISLANGDGFAFPGGPDGVIGFRGDVCSGATIRTGRGVEGLKPGITLYRNISTAFERTLDAQPCRRLIPVRLSLQADGGRWTAMARSTDGRVATLPLDSAASPLAENQERMRGVILSQLGKTAAIFRFLPEIASADPLPLLPASALNALRRELAEHLEATPLAGNPQPRFHAATGAFSGTPEAGYKYNLSNALSRSVYAEAGAPDFEAAYECTHRAGAELMRSRYCIRYELGMCLKDASTRYRGPLFLLNNGRRLRLGFDCTACEMTVSE